jgi:hypothetical protein
MPAQECPGSGKLIDMDGFYCARKPVIFLSECGKAYRHGEKFMELVEIPLSEIDISDLDIEYPPSKINPDDGLDRGVFVYATRWSGWLELQIETDVG